MTKTVISGNLPPLSSGNATTDYFDRFFVRTPGTSSNKNDMLVAFLQEWTGSYEAGNILAGVVLYTAETQGIDPAILIDEFQKLDKKQLNSYLTLFLNLNRVGTSLLGISNTPQTSKYISRAILP
jgi:hypothetical protein